MTLRLNKLYRRTMKQVSRSFVNGLLVLVPVIITLVLVIYAVGWASTNWALAKLIAFGENMIGTIPFVKFIYTSVKRLSEAVLDSSSNFKRVVHVPYQGARALGFVMADLPPRFQAAMGGGYICVFIPWSLNMTSGTTLLVKEEDAVTIDIPKEEALQYMLTAGAVMPLAERKKKSLPKKSAQSPADGVQEAED